MKNLHLLPKNKPSNYDIYITNNSKIKEGDWNLPASNIPVKYQGQKFKGDEALKCWKKIILTTDHNLIKDGVQTIDDEFLQWFVKNPSCEEVKVDLVPVNDFGSEVLVTSYGFDRFIYKIIVPKEEVNQEKLYTEKEVIEIVEKSRKTGLTAEYLIENFKNK